MKKIIASLSLILLTFPVFAQGITGDWYGVLNVQGHSLHLVFHIIKTADLYAATMDSPDQGASGLATDKTTFTGKQLTIEAAKFSLKYTGTYIADSSKISGTFTQGPGSLPLALTRTKTLAAVLPVPVARPQDPKDFPYKQEEVVFTNPKAGDQLAGTLTMPANGKATKIVVLITGSGPQNRNEEIVQFNHRPFLVWSDWLTRNGMAVLRYDDRGIAKSTGTFANATSADFADDAEAAVNYIKSRAELKGLSIGLMGHSEGGIIAPMVAAYNKDIKFVVMLAGPGVPIVQLMLKQADDQMRLGGTPDEARKLSMQTNEKLYTLVRDNPELSTQELQQKVDTVMYRELRAYPKADLNGANIDDLVKQSGPQLTAKWYRYFIAINPADYLTKVKCPVLALNGTLDSQVSCDADLAGIKADLQKAGNKHFEVLPLTGLNHLFQKATTGSVAEYPQIEETVDPIALVTVSTWINGL